MLYSFGDTQVRCQGDYFVADSADVIGNVVLGPNTSVWFNAVLRGDNEPMKIGRGSNIQDSSVLHTDPGFSLLLGEYVTVGHKVMLHGCTVGNNSLIGINSVILNGARIGENCLIGANTLITEGKEIPDNSVVMGSPGKVVREVTAEQVAGFHQSALHYIEIFKRYNEQLAAQDEAARIH